MTDLDLLKEDIAASIAAANDISALDAVRVAALGKKGSVTALMQKLGGLAPEERKTFGQAVNLLKNDIAAAIEDKAEKLKSAALDARLAGERVDITLTPRPEEQGAVHPISQTIAEMIHIFADMGFSVAEGPEIEDDFHNFTALNFPEAHPARAMHDTFYLPPAAEKGTAADTTRLLRTHTSTVQVHIMKDTPPPIRIVIPGRVYRSDYDQTHTPMFHQMEGLVIDTETNMSHLKGCLTEFCQRFFRIENLPIRLRPSFFPFTEPSAEVDIGCAHDSNGLRIGRAENSLAQKWMEVLGCGMVHPNVLKNCGIDPDVYQGFAFGMGVERFAMLKYGIPDLRTFFESDLRWLRHYGFRLLDRPDATNPL